MPTRANNSTKKGREIKSSRSLSTYVKSICDVMRRSNCASALQYVPELTWILFLRILDAQESRRRKRPRQWARSFPPALKSPYRWQDWAAPYSDKPSIRRQTRAKPYGWKRQNSSPPGMASSSSSSIPSCCRIYTAWTLIPHQLPNPAASRKQRIIGRIMTAVEQVRVDSETNLRDILDKVHEISIDHVDDTHFFTLSQVYEDLLLKMGEKNSDGGQFFTPREVIRAMVHTVPTHVGRETSTIPAAAPAASLPLPTSTSPAIWAGPRQHGHRHAETQTFFGREKENLVFPIALANLVLHGIDQPNLWHGNTLTKRATYDCALRQGTEQLRRDPDQSTVWW